MYGKLNSIRSAAQYRVQGAGTENVINALVRDGIDIICATPAEDFVMEITIPVSACKALEAIAPRAGCEASLISVSGTRMVGKKFQRRIFALVFGVLALLTVLGSRFFVWEISVSGNEGVKTGEILAALRDCGVTQGAFWPSFTSESIRSELITRIPELSWATVNMYGSRAEVIVRERVSPPQMLDESVFADIVAKKDGVISNIQTLIGSPAVQNGKAVTEGEVLISGTLTSTYADPKYTFAFGSVKAFTWYEVTAQMPLFTDVKTYTGKEDNRYSLKIGGNLVNFFRNSSIYDEQCDKIYSEWSLGIDGMFSLPVSIKRETSVYYNTDKAENDTAAAEALLRDYLAKALRSEVGDGEILTENYTLTVSDDTVSVCLRAACLEEIGVTVLR